VLRLESARAERRWLFAPSAGVHVLAIPLWVIAMAGVLLGLGVWMGIVPVNESRSF
jgi:hypothetical protein